MAHVAVVRHVACIGISDAEGIGVNDFVGNGSKMDSNPERFTRLEEQLLGKIHISAIVEG